MPSSRNSYTLRPKLCWNNTCWNKRNRLEKILIVSVAVLFILVLVLLIITLVSSRRSDICTTPECVKAANSIIEYIDPSKDPCKNFYEFTCGTFIKNAQYTKITSPLESMKEKVVNQLAVIVTEDDTEETPPKSLRLLRKFYQACTNITAIEEDKNFTFLKILEELGGWPLMKIYSSWDETNFNWQNVMVKSRNLGLTYSRFLEIGPTPHKEGDKLRYDLQITYPHVSKTDKLERDLKEDYINYMKDTAKLLGAASSDVPTELRKTVEFQEKLDSIIAKAQNSSENKTKYTIRELEEMYPQIQWLDFINNITGYSKQYALNDTVTVNTKGYLDDLVQLLSKDKRVQSNFIIWEIIENNIDFLSTTLRNRKQKFELLKAQHEKEESTEESRKDLCIRYSGDLFPEVAEAIFVRKYIDKDKLQDIKGMVKGIKSEIRHRLKHVDWMDSQSRQYALEKLKEIDEIIGGPDVVFDMKTFERKLGLHRIKFKSNNVIEMRNAVATVGINRYYDLLNEHSPMAKNNPIEKPWVSINSYFATDFQTLILSAGLLQEPFHQNNRPRYMNYGALGGIIGHEFTHGFMYTDGIDFKRPATNESWWTNTTLENFLKKSQCIENEYEDFREKFNLHNNKTNKTSTHETTEENIADFTGADLAYAAYYEWVRQNGEEPKLPGLKYTPHQLFWISYSFYMCFEPLDEGSDFFGDGDPHGIPSFRILGPLRNSKYFGGIFECPEDSYMNPTDKCQMF